jgi:hypothetical protein
VSAWRATRCCAWSCHPRTRGGPLKTWIPAGACPDCDGAGTRPGALYRDDALLHAIFGMSKHDQLFDGAKVYASSPAALTPAICAAEVA